jgi:hypothetical protein
MRSFATCRANEVLVRFIEIDRGCKPDRPELAKALHRVEASRTTLLIAKLDKLLRITKFSFGAAFLLASLRPQGNGDRSTYVWRSRVVQFALLADRAVARSLAISLAATSLVLV